MATYTTNYNLKKPADADSYDIADANGNMDIIDGALNTLNNQISKYDATSWIGNVTSIDTLNALTIPGRYRYYINISGVGLESGWAVVDVAALSGYDNYQQTITFASSGAVYTRMHSTGGTWGDFVSLSNQIAYQVNTSVSGVVYRKFGRVCIATVSRTISATAVDTELFTIPSGFIPVADTFVQVFSIYGNKIGTLKFGTNGKVTVYGDPTSAGTANFNLSYMVD